MRSRPVVENATVERSRKAPRIGWYARRHSWLRADVSPILSLIYEQACANPAAAAEDVLAFAPELGALDATAPLEIKDYPAAPLRDCNTEQIATLSRSEMDAITALLAPQRMLLEVFGYDLEAT